MSFRKTFRMTRIVLIALLALGLLIRICVRKPAGAAPARVAAGIDLVGQARRLVDEVAHSAQALVALDNEASAEEITQRRSALEAAGRAFQPVKAQIDEAPSSWVPLGRAKTLLEDAEEVAAEALRLTPSQPVSPDAAAAVDPLADDPNKTGFTEGAREIIESRVAALLTKSDGLRDEALRVAVDASETEATLLGFPVPNLLTAFLVISTALALVKLYQDEVRLRAPPEQTLKTQLKLKAKSDGRGAIQRCYELSTELLELAERLLAQTGQAKEETSQ